MKRFSLSRPTQLLVAANLLLGLVVVAELLLPAQPGTANAATAGEAAADLHCRTSATRLSRHRR